MTKIDDKVLEPFFFISWPGCSRLARGSCLVKRGNKANNEDTFGFFFGRKVKRAAKRLRGMLGVISDKNNIA